MATANRKLKRSGLHSARARLGITNTVSQQRPPAAGVSAAAALSWLVLRLLVAKPRVAAHLLLLQLCTAGLVCTVLAGFPFTGTSAIAGRWLYGAKGCMAQAFLQHVSVFCFDHCVLFATPLPEKRTGNTPS